MKKKLFYLLFIAIFCSCSNDILDIENETNNLEQKITSNDFSILQFSNRTDFYNTLENHSEIRSSASNDFVSLLDNIPTFMRNGNNNENLSYYEVNGYDELIPNKNFAKLLNPDGEIIINDTIYHINRNGTYYFPKEKEEEFRNIYEIDSIGTEISVDLYELADDIYRFDTFRELAGTIEIDVDSLRIKDNDIDTRSSGTEPNYDSFPSFKADRHTWLGKARQGLFGNDKWYSVEIKNISKKRKVRGRLYAYHYVFYSEAGITGQVKKKNWIGWSKEPAQEIRVGWKPVVLTVKIPELARINRPNIQHSTLTHIHGGTHPTGNAKVEWIQMLVPDDLITDLQIQTAVSTAIQMTFNYLKSQNNNTKSIECKNVIIVGKSTLYHIILEDMLIRNNTDEINKVFTSNYNILFKADLANIPNNIIGWANTFSGSIGQEYPRLESGEAIICGKEQNTWAGMKIVK